MRNQHSKTERRGRKSTIHGTVDPAAEPAHSALGRTKYLADDSVKPFVEYLTEVMRGKRTFEHSYCVKSKAWIKYLQDRDRGRVVTLSTMEQAFREYYWLAPEQEGDASNDNELPNNDDPRAARSTFSANEKVLLKHSAVLKEAIRGENEHEAFVSSIEILDWGQVYRGSVRWVLHQYRHEQLVSKLKLGTEILSGDQLENVAKFDGQTLRMDSGLTKIFALAADRSIVYDDRVGAAFGWLVRQFLMHERPDLQLKESRGKEGVVPVHLRFMRGPGKRNPSSGPLVFPSRSTQPNPHAGSNLLANWVLDAVVRNCPGWTMRKAEAALFMIGYDVSGSLG